MTDRNAIVREARAWVGTPFHHQASLKGVGCDCIGLIAGVARAFGMREAMRWQTDSRFQGYGTLPMPSKLLFACDEYMDQIAVAAALPGDVLLLKLRMMKQPMHFGILSDRLPRYIFHAYEPAGKVVENRIDEKWQTTLRAYRLRGVM
jgi:NlpC/P60 family putative phage cell wall peptidase